jgi:polygalacturonase
MQNFHVYAEDVCVSFLGTESNITVRNGKCVGPTHGISLGSYRDPNIVVSNILVENIQFDTQGLVADQAVRIKSSRSASGTVSNAVFSRISVTDNFKNHVYLDQNYPNRDARPPVNARMIFDNIQVNGMSGRASSRDQNIINCGRGSTAGEYNFRTGPSMVNVVPRSLPRTMPLSL